MSLAPLVLNKYESVRPVSAVHSLFRKSAQGATILAAINQLENLRDAGVPAARWP